MAEVTFDTFSPYAIIYEKANMSSVDELAMSSGLSASFDASSFARFFYFYFYF
jgi:hypothetical protein